jgi:2'-5' RNA ligase
VLCATGTRESDAAHDLARRLAEAAIAAGFAPDIKPFRAHLTLARKVNAAEAAKVEWPRGFSPAMTVRCDRFVLMQSRREEGGSIYSAVDSWVLDDDESR